MNTDPDSDPDAEPDPATFVSDLQDVKKNLSFLLITFVHLHLHQLSKIKSHKEVTEGINVFLTIFA
jgi:hypothetical protein